MYNAMNNTVKITRHESPIELAEFLEGIPDSFHYTYMDGIDPKWTGCSVREVIRTLREGDMKYVSRAQAIMDKIEESSAMSAGVKIISADVVGFCPIVPNVLAGLPYCMLTRATSEIEATNTPLCIYVDTTVSAGVSIDHLISRGVAVLAFTMAMNVVRPIDLYIVSTCQDDYDKNSAFGVCARIETRPLDLARASWMLVDPAMARRAMFTAMKYNRGGGQIGSCPFSFDQNPTNASYENSMRSALDMQPNDVFIRGGWLYDKLMHSDPVAWVNKMVQQHTTKQEE